MRKLMPREENVSQGHTARCPPPGPSPYPSPPASPPSPEGSGWRTLAHTPPKPTSIPGGEAVLHQPIYNPLHAPSLH